MNVVLRHQLNRVFQKISSFDNQRIKSFTHYVMNNDDIAKFVELFIEIHSKHKVNNFITTISLITSL